MNNAQCENHCPNCDSKDIGYETIEVGDVIYYPGRCLDCGCEFKEYFKYSDTEWESEMKL